MRTIYTALLAYVIAWELTKPGYMNEWGSFKTRFMLEYGPFLDLSANVIITFLALSLPVLIYKHWHRVTYWR